MTFANGRTYLAIPGPSVMPDRVLRAMHRTAPNIYTGELIELTKSLVPDLKSLAGTTGDVAMYIANGHGIWEAALSNVLSRGETVLVLGTGRFCHGWGEMAEGLGIKTEVLDFGERDTIDPARVVEALAADTAGRIKAVLMVHVDTSSSVRNDVPTMRAVLDRLGHPALLMVDCIASLACDRFEMDSWGADVMVAASQKGLMTPPGMGFVWFNSRAAAARDSATCATVYWDWRERINPDYYYKYFDGTAPTHHLYGLREALDMIAEEGLEAIWTRHEGLAHAVWAAVEAWGADGPMRLNIKDPSLRSHAVTSVELGSPDGERLQEWCKEKAGVTLGIGLGREPADAFFRIGHMGHVNAHMVLGTLAAMDAGLKALGIPHGAGALEAATGAIAKAA